MSQDELNRKGQDILQIVAKAKEFTEELLKENERLRFKIAALEAAGGAQASDERVQALQRRVHQLEEKLAEIETSYRKVEEENKEFADRYIEIEEQNNNLANLYVASYQLHSTLDFREVDPDRPGDRHQPDRGRGVPRADRWARRRARSRSRPPKARRPRRRPSRSARASSARPPRPAENYFADDVGAQRAVSLRPSAGRDPAQDQGLDDRCHLINKLLAAEDPVHDHGLRAVHAARRPRRDRDLLREALLPPPPGSSRRFRASWTWPTRSRRPRNCRRRPPVVTLRRIGRARLLLWRRGRISFRSIRRLSDSVARPSRSAGRALLENQRRLR